MAREVTFDVSITIDTKPKEWHLDDAKRKLTSKMDTHGLLYKLILLSKAGMISNVDAHATNATPNQNPKKWIFSDFDRIFEIVKKELNLETETYDLFGHSAGGQILHRYAIFYPNNKADVILAANSGWYTVPTFEHEFPYGLKNTGISKYQLKAAFGENLVVFLGKEDDENETRGSLRRTPEANRQGAGRLARGKYFFKIAQEQAKMLGTDFEWKLVIVPGVGHDFRAMSKAAAEYLYN